MEYLKKNVRTIVIALLIVGAITVISISGNKKDKNTSDQNATNTTQEKTTKEDVDKTKSTEEATENKTTAQESKVDKTDNIYTISAVKNDNQTTMVRKIIALYVKDSSAKLSAEQELYTETNLVNTLPRNNLIFVGDTIRLNKSQIKTVIDNSHQLTEYQISLWAQYL